VAQREILLIGDERLRRKARRITHFDDDLKELAAEMLETMRAVNGLGLAATQVGVPLRLAVIETPEEKDEEGKILSPKRTYILCNPEIVKASGEEEMEEGCLSVPGYAGRVRRATDVLLKARNLQGREVRHRGRDLLAQAFQHELDHLDGLLYVDRVRKQEDLWEIGKKPEGEAAAGEQTKEGST
jgi:peptide deformylase